MFRHVPFFEQHFDQFYQSLRFTWINSDDEIDISSHMSPILPTDRTLSIASMLS